MIHKLCHYGDTHVISGLEAIHLLGPGKKSEKHESILRGDRPLLSHEFIYPSTQQIFTEPPENGGLSYVGGGAEEKPHFFLNKDHNLLGVF